LDGEILLPITTDIIGKKIGHTISPKGEYCSRPYECWITLHEDFENMAELQQSGFVYEILEERKGDRCLGIVETVRREVDQDVLGFKLSKKRAMGATVVKLKVRRTSGLNAPVQDQTDAIIPGPDAIALAYQIPGQGIPVGVYALPSGHIFGPCVVRIPPGFLLGPEAAHLNIGGQTGFGKTAMALLMTKAILSDGDLAKQTCIVAFNVKADDLLWLEKQNPELTDSDKILYQALKLPMEPFRPVRIYAPQKPLDQKPNSLREDATPFTWEWIDVKTNISYAIAPEDWNPQLEALLSDLVSDDNLKEFDDIIGTLIAWIEEAQNQRASWSHGHHIETIRKALRIFDQGMKVRLKGLIAGDVNYHLPIDDLTKPYLFSVVDISRLAISAQRLVIGKIVSEAREKIEEGVQSDIKYAIFLSDELSRYAPKQAPSGPIAEIRRVLDDIAERGRSVGSIILGVEQYPSKISDSITGNVATSIYTRMKMTEMDASLYGGYSRDVKLLISNLNKGFAVIDNATFTSPIHIAYPRPPCAQRRPKT